MQLYVDIYSQSRYSTCFGCHAPIIRSTKNCTCYHWCTSCVTVEKASKHIPVKYVNSIPHRGTFIVPSNAAMYQSLSRSKWPRSLRRGSAASRLQGFRVRIPPGVWMSDCCECCVVSSRGLCVGLITRPEESCRVWCVEV